MTKGSDVQQPYGAVLHAAMPRASVTTACWRLLPSPANPGQLPLARVSLVVGSGISSSDCVRSAESLNSIACLQILMGAMKKADDIQATLL